MATTGFAATNEILDYENDIFVEPFAATREIALQEDIPWQGFSSPPDRDHLLPGDMATILVTGTGMLKRRQWLISLLAEEHKDHSPGDEPLNEVVLHTNSGRELRFTDSPTRLRMRTWGPFLETTTGAGDDHQRRGAEEARDLVNETFLRLGFSTACEAFVRLHQARTDGRVAPDNLFSVGIKPFAGRELQRGRQLAEAAGFEAEDERAIAGTVPALLEYFEIASRSPGIRSLVWELVEKPSVWSVVRRIGRVESGVTFHAKGVAPVAEGSWQLPAASRVFKLPLTLELNDKPALHCVLVVTQPRPPLLITAGILGMSVQSPGEGTERLFLRVIAARTAETGGGTID